MFVVTEQGIRQQREALAKAAQQCAPARDSGPTVDAATEAQVERLRESAGRLDLIAAAPGNERRAERVRENAARLRRRADALESNPGVHPGDVGKGYRPYIEAGHAADSPQNGPRPGNAGRHPQSGQFRSEIAAGHGVTSGGEMTCQPPMSPVPAARLASTTDSDGALASAISMHQGMAEVQRFDAASAASPGLRGQLGRNAPSGIPGQPPIHVAPDRPGAMFRVSPPRMGV